MFEIITNYPMASAVAFCVIIFLIRNKVIATNIDLVKLKESIIKDLKKEGTFVTTTTLGETEKNILNHIENKFLSMAVFNEFKSGIDRQFKTVFQRFDEGTEQFRELSRGINEIKNYLLEGKKK